MFSIFWKEINLRQTRQNSFPYTSYRSIWPRVNCISLNRLWRNIIQKGIPQNKKKLDNTATWVRSQKGNFSVQQTEKMCWCSKGMETKDVHNIEESCIRTRYTIIQCKDQKDERRKRNMFLLVLEKTVDRAKTCLFAHTLIYKKEFLVTLCKSSSEPVRIPQLPSSDVLCESGSRNILFRSV
jgi:hypothetical protein